MTPIGYARSCFREKFGIPRQSRLVPASRAVIRLHPGRDWQEALRGLEEFSHVWVLFLFHQIDEKSWKPLVRPPRLGGTRKTGILASRSPHRPNRIGMSAVKLERVDRFGPEGPEIEVSGVDFVDQTPILDIKPYLPYADSIPHAKAGWTGKKSAALPVRFSPLASRQAGGYERGGYTNLRKLIRGALSQDPRPAFQGSQSGPYAMKLEDFDVHWEVQGGRALVLKLVDLRNSTRSP